ncbi:SulP family inorganic anion transporter [Pullulanibacillus sp. KACC 23026]|uniref:SulP family inorganic anion transporter n=1 Tax=Pullulanibacillus sp. KACC 23026 TaxID=3028315 RepID=UPI0023B1988D|nr:SulP family inorganic anion transporter [Pullulanibacillus sp. KACC 23026]WEG12105.1 SulP family inorganic anion transporter [Pullulanibacillus sp. KACC 23026]
MNFLMTIKQDWFGNLRGDILSGLVVALALIPEAIAFSIIAGVDPMVGLYASFCIAVTISITGGRKAMISAATGSTALVMAPLVAKHGVQYLLAMAILTGVLQIIMGYLKIGHLMKFIPRPVMTGFVNALAILIFMAQLPQFVGEGWQMYVMVAGALAIIYILPKFFKAIPAPLVAILIITIIAIVTHSPVRTIGDLGALKQSLPNFMFPHVPLNLETLKIIFPYALTTAVVGLIESFLTAQIVDDMTDSTSNKNREAKGQGIANIVSGFFGGMAGCAMIGQTVVNVKSGGRGRLSTFVAGVFLLILIVVLHSFLIRVPMAALVGVMFMVSIGTFNWGSLKTLPVMPITDTIVMIATVIVVVLTNNLSIGVIAGVILSAIFFASKISSVHVKASFNESTGVKHYEIKGQLFFASVTDLLSHFDYKEQVALVELDLTHVHVWDHSAVDAIDRIVLKYKQNHTEVKIIGLNQESSELVDKIGIHKKPNAQASSH